MSRIIIPHRHQAAPKRIDRPAARPQRKNPNDPWGDPEGVVYHPDQLQEDANIVLWAKDAAVILEQHYPGWIWGIKPDPRGRMLTISSFRLSNEWGYHINLMKTPIEDAGVRRRVVIRAGGEFLERFGMRPGPFNRDIWRDRPRYVHGKSRPDIPDLHPSLRRLERDQAIDQAVRKGAIELGVTEQRGQRQLWVR